MYSFFSKFQLVHRPYSNQLQEMLLPYGISASQWGLLRYLFENGPSTSSDLVAYWQVEKPSITPIAQKLVAQGIIFILPGTDKRQKVMHLSDKGNAMYLEIKQGLDSFQEELMRGITQEERDVAEQLLDKLRLNLKERG